MNKKVLQLAFALVATLAVAQSNTSQPAPTPGTSAQQSTDKSSTTSAKPPTSTDKSASSDAKAAAPASTTADASLTTPESDLTAVSDAVRPDRESGAIAPARSTIGSGLRYSFSAQAMQTYDDNVFMSSSNRQADFVTMVTANFQATYLSRRASFIVNYIPAYNIYHDYTSLNFLDQDYSHQFRYRMTSRSEIVWTLNGASHPARGGSAFGMANLGQLSLGFGSYRTTELGSTLYTADSGLDWTYATSKQTRFGTHFRVSTNQLRADSTGPLSTSSRAYSGSVGLSMEHDYSASGRFTITADERYFRMVAPAQHSFYQRVAVGVQQSFGKWQISGQVGPGAEVRPAATINGIDAQNILLDFDAELSHIGLRDRLALRFDQTRAQSTLNNALGRWSAAAQYDRKLGKRLTVGAAMNYSRSDVQQVVQQSVYSFFGSMHASYQLSRHWSWTTNYGRVQQVSPDHTSAATEWNRNQFAFGLMFDLNSSKGSK